MSSPSFSSVPSFLKPQTIMNGFRKTIIYPLDKNALTTPDSLSSSSDTGDQSNETMDTDISLDPLLVLLTRSLMNRLRCFKKDMEMGMISCLTKNTLAG